MLGIKSCAGLEGFFLLKTYKFAELSLREIMITEKVNIEAFLKIAISIVNALFELQHKGINNYKLYPENIIVNNVKGDIAVNIVNKSEDVKYSQYMSPEETGLMKVNIDFRKDFYTLGVIFYEIIAGHSLINGEDSLEIAYEHLTKKFKEPINKSTEVPKNIWEIIKKLLNKNPENRYLSYYGLKFDLEKCLYQLEHLGCINNFILGQKDVMTNLVISRELFGRKTFSKKIGDIYDYINKNNKSVFMITGSSGSGKTSLINEFRKAVSSKNDYYISLSFQENSNTFPYFELIEELKNLVNRILMENEDNILAWKYRFVNTLGSSLSLILEYIPEFKLILGNDYEIQCVQDVNPYKGIVDLCERVIDIFTENNHIFMITLDDVQWINKSVIRPFSQLFNSSKIKNLLIVCSYVNSEEENLKNNSEFVEMFRGFNGRVETIKLDPLSSWDIEKLLQDIYNNSINKCDDLSNIIKIKTDGNLYCVNKFIKKIYDDSLIEYNYEKNHWDWDVEKVSLLTGKETLFHSMYDKLQELSEDVRSFLKNACCFRKKFSVYLMTKICNSSTSEMMSIISICLNKELIIELEPGEYVFSNKKIIEVINYLISDKEKIDTLLKIARTLSNEFIDYDSKIKIFDVLYYYNLSRDKVTDEKEILHLIKLNYEGGIAAKNSFAYTEATKYFNIAISFIDSKFWINHYELSYDIYLHSIGCFYSNYDFKNGDYYSEILLDKSKSKIDKGRLYSVRIRQYTNWNMIKPAIELTYKAINLMEDSSLAKLILKEKNAKVEYNKIINNIRGRDIIKFLNLPINTNIEKRILMKIYSNFWILGYISCNKKICFAAALRMFKISLNYGNMEDSAFGYACFGNNLINSREFELGNKFGILALNLNEKYENALLSCRVKFVYGSKINFWTNDIKKGRNYLEESLKTAINCGDYVYAANSAFCIIYYKFIYGEKLDKLQYEIDNILNFLENKNSQIYNNLSLLNNDILKLMGRSTDTLSNGEYEEINSDIFSKSKKTWFLFYYYISKSLQSFIIGNYEESLKFIENCKVYTQTGEISSMHIIYYFIYGLILIQIYEKVNKNKQHKYKLKINELNFTIKKYNEFCGVNVNTLNLLINAEIAKMDCEDLKAMNLYEMAINEANSKGEHQIAAVCNELAFKYYLSKNIKKVAAIYFNDCINCYENWGAELKVDKLKREYGDFLTASKVFAFDIDLNALFKASQIISNEIEYNNLLKKLIKVTMERAGAERCCLIIEKNGHLNVIADAKYETKKIDIYSHEIPMENYTFILKPIIYYVSRCKKCIVIDNAKKSEHYYGDKYINENDIKSILCIPICYNNKIKAILYFENNLVQGAFNKDAIEVLKLLTSQAAISLENALMYKSIKEINEKLETSVKERTKELEITVNMLKDEVYERKAVEEALVESESRLRTLINNTSDCITFKDGQGRYVEMNAAAVQFFGLEGIDYSNKSNLDLAKLVDKNKENFYKIDETDKIVLNEKKEMRFNQTLISRDGEKNYFDTVKSPVYNKEDENKALVVISRNITEKEKAEELKRKYNENARKLKEVMEYDKMRTEFIANISHELRTPLNVIISSQQMCKLILDSISRSEKMEKIIKYMGMTKQNSYRLLRLINNLIDITKIDSGYLTPVFIIGDIVNFIENITMSVVTFAESKGITIVFDTDVEEKSMPFDRDKIERIMLNLLSNAIKFTPEAGYIYVNIYDYFDKVSISVRDTGIGIPREKRTEIFNRFIQLDKSFTRANEGSGIGLSLVKSLVSMHKGEVDVKSEVGNGSEFIVTLPTTLKEDIEINKDDLLQDISEEKIEKVKIEFSDIYI